MCGENISQEFRLKKIAEIKYKSIIKKKRHDKIVLLAKSKLNTIEVLISKDLIDSNIGHDEYVLTNNVLKNIKK